MYTGIRCLGGGKYRLFMGSADQGVYTAEKLLSLRYANPGSPKKEEDTFDDPDPADGITSWNLDKLRSRNYTGIKSLGDGKYMMISDGRSQGIYGADKLLRLGYGFSEETV